MDTGDFFGFAFAATKSNSKQQPTKTSQPKNQKAPTQSNPPKTISNTRDTENQKDNKKQEDSAGQRKQKNTKRSVNDNTSNEVKKKGKKRARENPPKKEPAAKFIKLEDPANTENQKLYITDTVCSVIHGCDKLFSYQFHPQSLAVIDSTLYPRHSEYPCNLCKKKFNTIPIMIPTDYNYVTKCFHLKGNFCGFGCAKRSILENKSHSSSMKLLYLHILASDVFGIDGKLAIAPPSSRYICNGGDIDPEKYDNWNDTEYQIVVERPFVTHLMMISSLKNENQQRQNRNDNPLTEEEKNAFWQMRGVKAPEPKKNSETNQNESKGGMFQEFLKNKTHAAV